MRKGLKDADAVMMLRVQAERMHGAFFPSSREYAVRYGLTERRAALLPDHAVVLHPGPMVRGMEIAPAVADALTRFNSRLSFSCRPLEQDVSAALTQERLLAMLSSFFGGLALLLSALGLYGMTAHAAARRRTEIGIRLALGATPAGVIRLVLLRTVTLTGLGMLGGIAASAWASRFIASLLFGVQPRSPVTIAVAGLLLMVVAAIASAVPAWQAARTDPAGALREA